MSKTAKAAVGLFILTFFSKILGFVRDIMVAYKYGATRLNDIFIMSQDIPVLLFAIVTSAVATGFVPIYCKLAEKESREKAHGFTLRLMGYVTAMSVVFTLLGWYFMPQIIRVIAVGYSGEEFKLLVFCTRLLMPNIIFVGAASVLRAYHRAEGRYQISSINTVVINLVVMGFVIISPKDSITLMIIGVMIGLSIDFFMQWFYARKQGLTLKTSEAPSPESFKEFFYVIMPMILATLVGQVNTIVDKTMASTLPAGNITYLNNAFKLTTFTNGIFAVSLGTVLFSLMTNYSVGGKIPEFKRAFMKSINLIILVTIPLTVITIFYSREVVEILFERGAFTAKDTTMTAYVLCAYAVGMIGVGLREMIVKAYFALQDTTTPMRNGIFTLVINVTLDIVLIKYWGPVGLALATSFSITATSLYLFWQLRQKIGRFGGRKMMSETWLICLATLIMACVLFVVGMGVNQLHLHGKMQAMVLIVLGTGLGLITYAAVLEAFKLETWVTVRNGVLKKFKLG